MWDLFLNPLELTATLTGVVSVILSWRKKIMTYFFGLISVSIYVYICYSAGIYAEMAINVFYFIMSVYGWINWYQLARQNEAFRPSDLTKSQHFLYGALTLTSWVIIYFILTGFTDSNVPVADSFTTAFFITGMILMAKKITQNWIYLIIGNLVSIPLFIYKELYVSSVFFVILTLFACLGYLNWRREVKLITT